MPPGLVVGAAVAVRNARVTYPVRGGALPALDGVTLSLAPGEFISVIGPSGCGKSTLLRAIAGIQRLDDGSVEVDGRSAGLLAAGDLGLVFQSPALLPWRTVRQNVLLPLQAGRGLCGDVDGALALAGLAQFGGLYPNQLSGGMQQRAALARALVHRPRLLLLDEPFGALDEINREHLRLELLDMWQRDRPSVVFVTHSVREAVLLSDRVVVLSPRPGRVRAAVEVPLPQPRGLATEESPVFLALVNRLRGELR